VIALDNPPHCGSGLFAHNQDFLKGRFCGGRRLGIHRMVDHNDGARQQRHDSYENSASVH
jgi:hypothetical protein